MITSFQFGVDTQTINIVANQPTEVIYGNATTQAMIVGYYMEDFQGNFIAQGKIENQPTFDRIKLPAVNTDYPQAKITVFGAMFVNPQVQQLVDILKR